MWGCSYLMRGPSSISAIVSDVVPAIVPLVSVAIVTLLVAAAASSATATAAAAAAAPSAQVVLVRRRLRLLGPVPSVTPPSIRLLSAHTRAHGCSLRRVHLSSA